MKLKNDLIVVDDMGESIHFYQEMFGLQVIMKQEGNTIQYCLKDWYYKMQKYGQM